MRPQTATAQSRCFPTCDQGREPHLGKDMTMAEPLASLDPGGRAVVISYNVPEPTSYSGRNFIELSGIPREAFKSPAQPLASGAVSQPVVSRLSDEATRGATAVTGRMI